MILVPRLLLPDAKPPILCQWIVFFPGTLSAGKIERGLSDHDQGSSRAVTRGVTRHAERRSGLRYKALI